MMYLPPCPKRPSFWMVGSSFSLILLSTVFMVATPISDNMLDVSFVSSIVLFIICLAKYSVDMGRYEEDRLEWVMNASRIAIPPLTERKEENL